MAAGFCQAFPRGRRSGGSALPTWSSANFHLRGAAEAISRSSRKPPRHEEGGSGSGAESRIAHWLAAAVDEHNEGGKMNTRFQILGIASLALALRGCTRKSHEATEHDTHATQAGVTFNSKQGLSVPPTTAKYIGLQVADVEERNVTSSVRFGARVYQTANERQFVSAAAAATSIALASAFVSPAQAALLTNGKAAIVVANGKEEIKGEVVAENRSLEKVQGQAEVMLTIEDPGARLTNGVIASISVPLGREQSVVTIPRSALLRTAEGDFVYTMSGKQFVRTAIKTDDVNDDLVEV